MKVLPAPALAPLHSCRASPYGWVISSKPIFSPSSEQASIRAFRSHSARTWKKPCDIGHHFPGILPGEVFPSALSPEGQGLLNDV